MSQLSNISKIANILSTSTGLDVMIFDHNYNCLVTFSQEYYPFEISVHAKPFWEESLATQPEGRFNTVYQHTVDFMSLIFYDMKVQLDGHRIYYLLIGPVLMDVYSNDMMAGIFRRMHIPEERQAQYHSFYRNLLYQSSQTDNLLWLYHHMFTTHPTLTNIIEQNESPCSYSMVPFEKRLPKARMLMNDEILINYDCEIRWRDAVRHGDYQLAMEIMKEMANTDFVYRTPTNPLRSRKNLLHSVNAICRTSATDGGADVIEIHDLHEHFSIQIEAVQTVFDINKIDSQIVRAYCDLVLSAKSIGYSSNVRRAIQYINAHYSQAFSLSDVAAYVPCSDAHLSRIFFHETGQHLREYVNEIRLKRSLSLLENTNLPITEIALMTGFSSYNKFSAMFKNYTGISAGQYRKTQNKTGLTS